MARYIDADKFADAICNFPAIDEQSANAVILLLRRQPTADVEEVRHGHWIKELKDIGSPSGVTIKNTLVGYRCSECGRTEFNREPYCNCGAKMDAEGADG